MNSKFFAAFIMSQALLFCACGSDEETESLSDKCRKGDDASCLVGTWQMLAIEDAGANFNIVVDFSTGPGTLVIYEDGTFKYTYATAATSLRSQDCGGQENTGKWTYDKTTKTFSTKSIVGEPCTDPTSATVTVNEKEMTFGKTVFQIGEDVQSANQPVEYYKRIGAL